MLPTVFNKVKNKNLKFLKKIRDHLCFYIFDQKCIGSHFHSVLFNIRGRYVHKKKPRIPSLMIRYFFANFINNNFFASFINNDL